MDGANKPLNRVRTKQTVVNRWDEKSRSPERDAVRSQVIDALEAQEIKETGMKKVAPRLKR